MKLTAENTYTVPGLDALIGVQTFERHGMTLIYFASKGCSRTKAGLKRRNPDRRAAIDRVVARIGSPVVVVSGGKAGTPDAVCQTSAEILKAARRLGNYRVDLTVDAALSPEALGLVLRAKS